MTVSTGNRNFVGKQGEGEDYSASPATAAATAVAGAIATARSVLTLGATAGLSSSVLPATLDKPNTVSTNTAGQASGGTRTKPSTHPTPPTHVTGRVWVIRRDNIDTDMIFHNRHLAITDIAEMGKHAFGNLAGWQDFAAQVRPGDIVVTGENFGCGSSRQQAVDCFKSLGVALLVARSFGAIYERNAVNNALPILKADLVSTDIADGEMIQADFTSGEIRRADGQVVRGRPFSQVQMEIYRRGGLLSDTE